MLLRVAKLAGADLSSVLLHAPSSGTPVSLPLCRLFLCTCMSKPRHLQVERNVVCPYRVFHKCIRNHVKFLPKPTLACLKQDARGSCTALLPSRGEICTCSQYAGCSVPHQRSQCVKYREKWRVGNLWCMSWCCTVFRAPKRSFEGCTHFSNATMTASSDGMKGAISNPACPPAQPPMHVSAFSHHGRIPMDQCRKGRQACCFSRNTAIHPQSSAHPHDGASDSER